MGAASSPGTGASASSQSSPNSSQDFGGMGKPDGVNAKGYPDGGELGAEDGRFIDPAAGGVDAAAGLTRDAEGAGDDGVPWAAGRFKALPVKSGSSSCRLAKTSALVMPSSCCTYEKSAAASAAWSTSAFLPWEAEE